MYGHLWISIWAALFSFFKILKNACDKRAINCLYETKLKEVITSLKGEVVGIHVESKGNLLHIKAKKAIVLACGGYAYNLEMLKQYSFDKGYRAKYTGSVNHTGDGIRAGQLMGADLRCMGQVGVIPAVTVECMTALKVEDVFQAVVEQLDKE